MHTLRHAFRTITKTPWLSAVVIASLAIGIGTNTVIFSWLKAQVFEPLPRGERAGLVARNEGRHRQLRQHLLARISRPARDGDVLRAASPRNGRAPFISATRSAMRASSAQFVPENFFEVLGMHAGAGPLSFARRKRPGPGAEPVAVISHDFWQRHFRGARGVDRQDDRAQQPHAHGRSASRRRDSAAG